MVPPKKLIYIEHPQPSNDLAKLTLPIKILSADTTLFRIHKAHVQPKFFGRTLTNRFDASDGSYGVMYLGLDQYCSFIETFGQQTGQNFVTVKELEMSKLAFVKVTHKLKVVNLTGYGLARIGADNRLTAGAHPVARKWSKALHAHPNQVDGIYFRACHDPDRFSLALFDRAKNKIAIEQSINLLSSEFTNTLSKILDKYNFALG
jgi:hypothetical protein